MKMLEQPHIDLKPHDWHEVCHVLEKAAPEFSVWAFGSRVKGTAKEYSDLDLALMTNAPLSLERLAAIKEAFDESDLSIRVDIVDWAATSTKFQEIISKDKVIIQDPLKT